MLLITCPATRTDELVPARRIRSAVNHPTHIALHVDCPACPALPAYRTGRPWAANRAARAASPPTTAHPREQHFSA